MNLCPKCGKRYPGGQEFCPQDGATLALGEVVDAIVGRDLGNFRVERVLGAGGMGTVFLARHRALGTPAVVKVLHPMVAGDPECKRRFLNEARLASAIQHPNVVRIFDFGETGPGGGGSLLYMVMELVEGEDLETTLAREKRLDPIRAARLLRQVAGALDTAHSSAGGPVVHRDLKPANIRLTRRGREEHAIVLDFGIAKALAGASADRLTRAGMVIGTPRYMAPEQASGGEVDPRTDLYALGIVAYELIAGKPPFRGDTIQLIAQHLHAPPPAFPEELKVPKPLSDIVFRLLEKDATKRYQSAAELVEALDRFIGAASGRAGGRRAALAAVLFALVACAVAVFGALSGWWGGAPVVLRLKALRANGKDVLGRDAIYSREPVVQLDGEVDGLARLAGAALAIKVGRSEPAPVRITGDRFAVTVDAPPERSPLSIELSGPGGRRETLLARAILCDTRPPRIAVRSRPQAYRVEGTAPATVYLRQPRAFVAFELADDGAIAPDILRASAASPLEAVVARGAEGIGVEVDCRRLAPGEAATLRCTVADEAGNEATTELRIVYVGAPPTVKISLAGLAPGEPMNGVPVLQSPEEGGREVALFVEARSAAGIDRIALRGIAPSGATETAVPAGADGSFRLVLCEEGEHVLEAEAYDRAGGSSTTSLRVRFEVPLRASFDPPVEASVPLFVRTPEIALAGRASKALSKAEAWLEGEGIARRAAAEAEVRADDARAFALRTPLERESAQALFVRLTPRVGTPLELRLQIVQDGLPPALDLAAPEPWPEAIGAAAAPRGALGLEVQAKDAHLVPEVVLSAGTAGGPPPAPVRVPLGPEGHARIEVPLVHGTTLALSLEVRDRAGNAARIERQARVDLVAPTIVASRGRFKLHEPIRVEFKTDEPCERVLVGGSEQGVRRIDPQSFVYEATMYLDTPLRRRLEAIDSAGNRGAGELALEREDTCATTGTPIPPEAAKRILEDRTASPLCPFCDKPAASRGEEKP